MTSERPSLLGRLSLLIANWELSAPGVVRDLAIETKAEIERLQKLATEQGQEIALTRERDERLEAALRGIAEFCSGDGRPLGAIERLVAARNTAERAADA